jgi:hypothetical protein
LIWRWSADVPRQPDDAVACPAQANDVGASDLGGEPRPMHADVDFDHAPAWWRLDQELDLASGRDRKDDLISSLGSVQVGRGPPADHDRLAIAIDDWGKAQRLVDRAHSEPTHAGSAVVRHRDPKTMSVGVGLDDRDHSLGAADRCGYYFRVPA